MERYSKHLSWLAWAVLTQLYNHPSYSSGALLDFSSCPELTLHMGEAGKTDPVFGDWHWKQQNESPPSFRERHLLLVNAVWRCPASAWLPARTKRAFVLC